MSAVPPGPVQPPKGIRETRIAYLWDEAWKHCGEGKSYQFFPSQAAAELAEYRAQLPAGDTLALADLRKAENLDRGHRENFADHLARLDSFRATMNSLREFMLQNISKVGFFALQMLALANGAVALGALTYMGRDGAGPIPIGMILVLIFSAVGFLLTLLSAHISTLHVQPFLKLLTELGSPWISDADRISKSADIPAMGSKATFWPKRISYVAAVCLVTSLIIGATSLWQNSNPTQKPPSGTLQRI